MQDLEKLFGEIAVAAGVPIMDVYAKGVTNSIKADGSPVTEADMRAEELILQRLAQSCGGIPVIAEESMAAGRDFTIADQFILVDPLDGTKEFIHRRDEFTVNLALIVHGRPVAGAIFAPALGRLWIGGESGARHQRLRPGTVHPTWHDQDRVHSRRFQQDHAIAVASRSHADAETDAFLSRLAIQQRLSRGSSLKFCLIATGEADVYPRFSPTMEWDIAAGHAILSAAGGCVTDPAGHALSYGKTQQGFCNGPFVAWGDPAYQARVCAE